MRRLDKISILCIFILSLVMVISIPAAVAEEPDFEENDIITFGYQYSMRRTVETTDNKQDESYNLVQTNNIFEIDDIDDDDKLIDVKTWNNFGEDSDNTWNYSTALTENFMIFKPIYTSDGSDVVLISIWGPLDTGSYLFIDPDWEIINENLADSIDDWSVSVTAGTKDIDDFEGDVDIFSLMGKDNLNDGLDEFKETTHKWSGKFTLEGDVFYLDGSDYKEYDSYELSWEVEYSKGGTLVKAQQTRKVSVENKFSWEQNELMQNKAVNIGTGGGGIVHAFELPVILIAVITSVVTLRALEKRKKV